VGESLLFYVAEIDQGVEDARVLGDPPRGHGTHDRVDDVDEVAAESSWRLVAEMGRRRSATGRPAGRSLLPGLGLGA
jgi:hypothetical protein